MLLALLLALTIDPVASESAATATTTTSTEIVALTEAEAKAVEPVAVETSDVVSGVKYQDSSYARAWAK